jgi:TrpR-related protein YerC/YecD
MAKFSLNKLPKEKRIQMIAEFYDVINSLKNRKEVRLFFRDLLTPDEIAMLMRRIEVAALLLAGFTYEQIMELLGVGKDKINNVQKSLVRHGEGYKIVIKRLLQLRKSKIKKLKKIEKTRHSYFENLKKDYPLYFLLFNLIDEIGDLLNEEKIKDKEVLLKTPSLKNFSKKTKKPK